MHIAVEKIITMLRTEEIIELARFQYFWPSRFGKYPHTAAAATFLRYDERAIVAGHLPRNNTDA